MTQSKRILVICKDFPKASETFVVEHIIGLLKNNWDVRVACLNWVGDAWSEIATKRLPGMDASTLLGTEFGPLLTRLKNSSVARRLFLLARFGPFFPFILSGLTQQERIQAGLLRAYVKEWRPAVTHAHFGSNAVLAAVAQKGTGIPLIVEFHGTDVNTFPMRRGWGLYRNHLSNCTAISHSRFIAQRVQDAAGIDSTVITFGVNGRLFEPSEKGDSWQSPLRILQVGRLVPHKGQEVAIRALKHIDRKDIRLVLVGEGPDLDSLRRLRDELGLQDQVEFTGAVPHDEVAQQMARADVLLVPSRRGHKGAEEAFGLVAAEGMAMGLAVVVSDCGGLPDTVADGALVVRQDDPQALATGIAEVLEESPKAWAERALASAKRFDAAAMHDEYNLLATELVQRQSQHTG